MRLRYVGPDEARFLTFPGGGIECPRDEWVNPLELMAGASIPAYHLPIVIRGLIGQDGWQVEEHLEVDADDGAIEPPEADPPRRKRTPAKPATDDTPPVDPAEEDIR